MIIAVIYPTFAVAKREPEKNQVCMGFEPFKSAIQVQDESSPSFNSSLRGSHIIFIYKLEVIFSCTYRNLDEPSQSRNRVNLCRVISPLSLGWDQKKYREGYPSLKVSVLFFFFFQTNININRFIIPRKHAYLDRC